MRAVFAIAAAASVLAGCTGARHHELDPARGYWFRYPADQRGAVLMPYDRRSSEYLHFCAEPAPDVALQQSMTALARVTTPAGISGEGSLQLTSEVVALAGRTATLLALREMLYRLCEMSMNGILSQAQAAPLYEKTIEAMLKLANAELAQTIKTAPVASLPAIGEALQPTQ